jgi:hypothetical protein
MRDDKGGLRVRSAGRFQAPCPSANKVSRESKECVSPRLFPVSVIRSTARKYLFEPCLGPSGGMLPPRLEWNSQGARQTLFRAACALREFLSSRNQAVLDRYREVLGSELQFRRPGCRCSRKPGRSTIQQAGKPHGSAQSVRRVPAVVGRL